MVTAQNQRHTLTRNTLHFKPVPIEPEAMNFDEPQEDELMEQEDGEIAQN